VNSFTDDEIRNRRHQKARDRYANMPLDKKAELNARKRELLSNEGEEAIRRFVQNIMFVQIDMFVHDNL